MAVSRANHKGDPKDMQKLLAFLKSVLKSRPFIAAAAAAVGAAYGEPAAAIVVQLLGGF